MSNFNSADIAAFKDVWVFCEQREGKLMPTDFELISKGRDLADELGVNLCGLLLGGEGIESAAKELGGYGADKVLVCESPLLAVYNTDAYAKVICDVIEDLKPEAFLIGATNIGRDLGPRCAARLHTGLCADCTHLDVDVANYIQFLRESSTLDVDSQKWDMEDRNLKMTRPAFGGHLMATIICPRFRPCMATVRPGVMKKNVFDQAKADACEIVKPSFQLSESDLNTEVVEVVKAAKKLVDLIGADYIVSVGRGISKDVEGGYLLFRVWRRMAHRSGTDRCNGTVQSEAGSPCGSRPVRICPARPTRIPWLHPGTLRRGISVPAATGGWFLCLPDRSLPGSPPYRHGSRRSPCSARIS